MKNFIIKFYGISMICSMLIFCFASILLSTNISAKAESRENQECAQECFCNDHFEIEENYDYAYKDYNGKHILQNQSFIIPFIINSDSKIIDYSFEQTGFKVLASSIKSEKQIDFELNCIPNSSEYWLSVQIVVKSKKIIKGNLYAVANESGVFISQFSKDNALENYFDYALKNRVLTEDEISTLTKLNYSRSVTETSYTVKGLDPNFLQPITDQEFILNGQEPVKYNANTKSGEDTYLQGTLEWEDDNGVVHPLRRIMVNVYDYDGALPDYLLGTVFTDNNGNYSFAFENNDGFGENGGYDLYIRAYAGDNNAMVDKNAVGTRYWWESDDTGHMNVSTGSTTTISMDIDMTSDLGRAFQISQALLTARDYAWNMTGNMPSDVSARYPDGNGCSYNSSLNRIYITGNAPASSSDPESYASWDVIMHEYGHHIQYDENITNSPGGSHSSSQNNADERGDKDEGIRLAWGESWPTVFGIMAQKYWSNYLNNIITVNDTSYTAYNGANYDIDITTVRLGEACERSIMAVLWDLYDSGSETDDTIALGHQSWWDVTTDGEDKTFSEFIQSFYSSYPQYIDNIGANLSNYRMAPTGVTAPSSSVLTTTPPTFSWTAQGGSTLFPNNSFKIKVFNKDQSLSITTSASSNTNRTLTTTQWNTVLGWSGETIYVAVAGYQTDSPSTGEYVSEYIAFTKPIFISTTSGGETTITGTYSNIVGALSIPATIDGTIPVTTIAAQAFKNQADITSVTFPSTITTIGNRAFQFCNSLSSVNMSSTSVTRIEAYTFDTCSITSISFPSTLTYIGEGAFIRGGNISSIPTSVSTLGDYAFANVDTTRLIIPINITNIGYRAFRECSSLTIYTEFSSRPSTWNTSWNNSNRPVIWGCTLSSNKGYVISFTKTSSNPSNPSATNGITQPYRSGYSFGGWYTTSNYSGTQYMDVTAAPNGTLYAKWNKNSCVAEGTMITLADGSQKAVELLTMDDLLLVWNHHTGAFDVAPMVFIDSDPLDAYEIIHLYFSDGTDVKVIYEHAFWNATLNKYVFIRDGEAMQYIGDWFNKQTYDINGNMIWENVQLVDVQIYTEQTTAWSPVTFSHLNYYVNGMLSMPGATEGLINIFEVDAASMYYDANAFAADIETYGLFTYEEFAEIIPVPEIVFEAFNGQYLKVSIGKGLINIDDLITLVERYSEFFSL